MKQSPTEIRRAMEEKNRRIGRVIGDQLPPGWGFMLYVFEMGTGGESSYICNAERADMVFALRELADRLEKGGISAPFAEN